jgi:hypothetical protein
LADDEKKPEAVRDAQEAAVWQTCVSHVLHPVKVAIIEAHLWIGQPLSAKDLERLFDYDPYYLATVSYHCNKLAEIEVLSLLEKRPVRGVVESRFVLVVQPE